VWWLDDHGRDWGRELDYDRDHYRKQDGFHEMFGRRDLVIKNPMWDYFSSRNYFFIIN
jgi:hypothetical protein